MLKYSVPALSCIQIHQTKWEYIPSFYILCTLISYYTTNRIFRKNTGNHIRKKYRREHQDKTLAQTLNRGQITEKHRTDHQQKTRQSTQVNIMTEHRKELQNRPQQRPSRPPNQYVYKKTSCFGSHSGCPHCIQNRLGLLFIISSTLVYLQPKITSIVI